MNLGEDKVSDDIRIIKETLEQTKSNFNGLHTIIFLYGVFQLVSLAITWFITSIFGHSVGYELIPHFVNIIASVSILIIYLKIFRKEKNVSNKYYLSCLAMWGGMVVFLPFILLAARVGVFILNPGEYTSGFSIRLDEFKMLINVMLVSFCFIICSFITNKKWLIGVSLLILLTFLILDISFYGTLSQGDFILGIFYFSITTVGYIALSFIIKNSGVHDGHK